MRIVRDHGGVNPVHTDMMPPIDHIEEEIAQIEAALADSNPALAAAAAELEAARAAVSECAQDDPAVTAAEMVRRRREAAERLEVAELEHSRAETAARQVKGVLEGRLAGIGRGLESLVMAEADNRRKHIAAALRKILGKGASRLPSLIENAADWPAELSALQQPLRMMNGDAQSQISLIRRAIAALVDPGPEILPK